MKQIGYTLIELLVALSIFSILALSSISLTRTFTNNHRQSVQVNTLLNALQYARMSAIRYGEMVTFCGSHHLETCDGHWERGQIIKMKNQILRIFPSVASTDRLFFQSSFGKNDALIFTPLGFTHGQQGSFYYISKVSKKGYRIIVSYTGAVRSEAIEESELAL